MHKPESIQENETHKILWDFEIQTDDLIPVSRLDLVLINRRKKDNIILWILLFQRTTEWKLKKINKNLEFSREQKAMKNAGDSNTCSSWYTWNGPQRIGKGIGTVANLGKNQDHPNNSIVEISQNTEKSPGDLFIKILFRTLLAGDGRICHRTSVEE